MDHERYPNYTDDVPTSGGSFIEELYDALVSAAQRFFSALPAMPVTRR